MPDTKGNVKAKNDVAIAAAHVDTSGDSRVVPSS
jgi:hypothetical protein